MAKELESQSQQVTSEDPWHEGDGDPWEKTNESLKVSDSPVSEDGTKKVTSPLQTEEGTDTTEKKDDQGVTGGAAAGSSQDVKREDPETEDTKREDTKTEDAKKDDATETREVKEETKVDSQTTHTPDHDLRHCGRRPRKAAGGRLHHSDNGTTERVVRGKLLDVGVESKERTFPEPLELGSRRSMVMGGSFAAVKWKLGRFDAQSQKGHDEGNWRGNRC